MGTIVCVYENYVLEKCKLELMYTTCLKCLGHVIVCVQGVVIIQVAPTAHNHKNSCSMYLTGTWCVHPLYVALTQQEKESTLR